MIITCLCSKIVQHTDEFGCMVGYLLWPIDLISIAEQQIYRTRALKIRWHIYDILQCLHVFAFSFQTMINFSDENMATNVSHKCKRQAAKFKGHWTLFEGFLHLQSVVRMEEIVHLLAEKVLRLVTEQRCNTETRCVVVLTPVRIACHFSQNRYMW